MAILKGYVQEKNGWYYYADRDGKIWLKVKEGKIPTWFKKSVVRYHNNSREQIRQKDVFRILTTWNFFDHNKTIRKKMSEKMSDGEIYENFLTEPYGLYRANTTRLLTFCEQYRMDFSITGNSYNGLHAVKIEFTPNSCNEFSNVIQTF